MLRVFCSPSRYVQGRDATGRLGAEMSALGLSGPGLIVASASPRLLFYPRNPDLVLVDTAVVARAPLRLLVSGMGDALATWFEARTVIQAHRPNQRHGATTLAGEALARLCCETLLADGPPACEAVRHGVVAPALDRLVTAGAGDRRRDRDLVVHPDHRCRHGDSRGGRPRRARNLQRRG